MKLLNTHNCLHIKQKNKLDQFSLRQFEVRVVHSTMKSIEILLSFDVFILQHGNYLSHLIVTRNRRILTFSLSEILVPFLPYCLKHL